MSPKEFQRSWGGWGWGDGLGWSRQGGEGREGVRAFKNHHLADKGNCESGRMGGENFCLKHKAGSAHSHT